jgi:CDP-diacylglycerol--glycerol-3-phosphate 3-phosphatidyltransferase
MKYVPNLLSVFRIVFSVLLLFIKPFDGLFYAVYIFCGISDMLDGTIARKTKSMSSFGALLDSVGDAVFCAVMIFVLLPVIIVPVPIILWIIGIATVRIASLAVGYYKYRKLAFLHTYLNKLTGLVLFLIPLFYRLLDANFIFIAACILASVSAAEELIINIRSKELDRNTKGILDSRKRNA